MQDSTLKRCVMASEAACVVTLAVLAIGGCASPASKVEVLRDRWGVPHVFAATDAGAFYGLGYACAEDRGFQMTYSLRIIQGRLAEVIGEVRQISRPETSVDLDRKMRTFGFYRAAQRTAAALDPQTRQLLSAYCEGVNAYFRGHRGQLHPLFDRMGLRPEPWTPADCLASWWHLGQFFAGDGTSMCTAPPLAVDRLIGLADASKNLVGRMEDGKLPTKMNAADLNAELTKLCRIISRLLDRDIFPWLDAAKDPTDHERDRASTIVADRLCSAVANPIVRNAQEQRQLKLVGDWLDARGYRKQAHPGGQAADRNGSRDVYVPHERRGRQGA